jgi:hypothetical protein
MSFDTQSWPFPVVTKSMRQASHAKYLLRTDQRVDQGYPDMTLLPDGIVEAPPKKIDQWAEDICPRCGAVVDIARRKRGRCCTPCLDLAAELAEKGLPIC